MVYPEQWKDTWSCEKVEEVQVSIVSCDFVGIPWRATCLMTYNVFRGSSGKILKIDRQLSTIFPVLEI